MTENRRPISSRSNRAIQALARRIAASNVTPNQISTASIAFAAMAGAGLVWTNIAYGAVIAVIGIQLRLLCNVLDGLVAVEGGKKSALGALYNEFPDRIADSLILIATGYAANLPTIGWLAALLAALTAYIRVFGGSLGLKQEFLGPMAKQHRMAAITVGCIFMLFEYTRTDGQTRYSLATALIVIAAGSAITCWTRTRSIARTLGEGNG